MFSAVEYEGGREERILGGDARFIRASREPCLVCGHPTGDCTGDSGPPIRVLGPNIFPSMDHEEMFVVEEDVWETVQISKMTTTRVLVAKAGNPIPMSKAKDLGLC